MPQKQLKPGKKIDKKQDAANRHGKTPVTRKGKYEKPPKKIKALELYQDEKEVSKAINKRNESSMAGVAEQKGGKLKMIKGPPPVLASKDRLKKDQKEKRAQAQKAKAAPPVEDMEEDD
ncbi:hypothetical protein TSOC_006460 [Tetrabaena socialis]|uniref:Uncharacterized protein n=1 Tax=Tetrabaena socialis TaxID=47790 RepID=A0A2J8A3K7_9CHLO|nr:hypothetical protein TSOC_006460 [Tetrabaena socialis]|eukprot:PNH07102.1 hypothetical protein TSOC_006460 [Tetrabaena socialis]